METEAADLQARDLVCLLCIDRLLSILQEFTNVPVKAALVFCGQEQLPWKDLPAAQGNLSLLSTPGLLGGPGAECGPLHPFPHLALPGGSTPAKGALAQLLGAAAVAC